MANNHNRIVNRYKPYITSKQRTKLGGLYKGYQQTMADERREQYLANRRAMGGVTETASAYGLGQGYINRKKRDIDASMDKYSRQLDAQADAAFEKEVLNQANQTIDARNKAAQEAHRKKVEAARKKAERDQAKFDKALAEYNRMMREKQKVYANSVNKKKRYKYDNTLNRVPVVSSWNTPSHVRPNTMGKGGIVQYTDSGSSNGGNGRPTPRVIAPPPGIQKPGQKPKGGTVQQYTDTGTKKREIENAVKKGGTPVKPKYNVDKSYLEWLPPEDIKQIENTVKEVEAMKPAELEKFKQEKTNELFQMRNSYERDLVELDKLAAHQQNAVQHLRDYNALVSQANDPSLSVAQRKERVQMARVEAQDYKREMDSYRTNSVALSGVQRKVQAYFPRLQRLKGLLGALGIEMDEDEVAFKSNMVAQGYAIPTITNKEFWEHAQNEWFEKDDKGKVTIHSALGNEEWFKENGYADLIKDLYEQYSAAPLEKPYDGRPEKKTLSQLADWNGAIANDPAKAQTYFYEQGLNSYMKSRPLNFEQRTDGSITPTEEFEENRLTMWEAVQNDGLLRGLLRGTRKKDVGERASELHEGTLKPDLYANEQVDIVDYYRRVYEAAQHDIENGRYNSENVRLAYEWDYLAELIRAGKEEEARKLAIDLLDTAYQKDASKRMTGASVAEQYNQMASAQMRNAFRKAGDFFSDAASARGRDSATADVFTKKTRERWQSKGKTDEQKEFLGKAADLWTSAVESTFDNMPARIVGMAPGIGKYASKALFFLSAAGGAKQEALRKGADLKAAWLYSSIIGASEVGLETLIGGIPLGSKSTLSKALEKWTSNIPHALLRALANLGVDAAGEFTEESLQEVLEPIWGNLILGENNDINPFRKEVLDAGLSGALASVLGSGPRSAVQQLRNTATLSSLRKAGLSHSDAQFYLMMLEKQANGQDSSDKDLWTFLALEQGLTNGEFAKEGENGAVTKPYKGVNLRKNLGNVYEGRNASSETFDTTDHRPALSSLNRDGKVRYLTSVGATGKVGDMYYVTQDGKALDTSKMSLKEKVNYSIAQKLAKAFPNIKVVVHDALPGVDGGYETIEGSEAVLHVALSSNTILATVAAHELLHGVESNLDSTRTNAETGKEERYSKDYEDIVNYLHAVSDASIVESVEKAVSKKYGITWTTDANGNRVFNEVKDANGKVVKTAAQAQKEFDSEVATHLAEKAFTDDEFLDRIIRDSDPKNQTARARFINRLRDSVKKLVKALHGEATVSPRMTKLSRKLENAYRALSKTDLSKATFDESSDIGAIQNAENENNLPLDNNTESQYNEANTKEGAQKDERRQEDSRRSDEGRDDERDGVGEDVGSRFFERRSDDTVDEEKRKLGRGNQRVSQRHLNKALKDAFSQSGRTATELYDYSNDRAAFSNALDAARNADTAHGWAVTPQSESDLEGKALFMDKDGTIGAAVTEDGDIEGVFKNKSLNKTPHALDGVMPQLIAAGGTKLDCYGEGLVRNYENYGFIPVARVEFNPEYANEGWDESKGMPYVYFLYHNGDSAAEVVSKIGEYSHLAEDELNALPTFDKEGYEQGMELRDNILAERKNTKFRVSDEEATEYMDLAQKYTEALRGGKKIAMRDEQRLRAIVEKAAANAGLTPTMLFHGTNDFGFDEIDPLAGDDNISFFATDSEETAGTYTSGRRRELTRPNDETGDPDFDSEKAYNEANHELAQFKFFIRNGGPTRNANLFGGVSSTQYKNILWPITGLLDSITRGDVMVSPSDVFTLFDNVAEDFLYTSYVNYLSDHQFDDKKPSYDEWLSTDENQKLSKGIHDRADSVAFAVEYLMRNTTVKRGIYQLYANQDGLLEVDAGGSQWFEIPFEFGGPVKAWGDVAASTLAEYNALSPDEREDYTIGVDLDDGELFVVEKDDDTTDWEDVLRRLPGTRLTPQAITEAADKILAILSATSHTGTTRDLAQYAYDNGYSGVKINRVLDPMGGEAVDPANVYIFLDPAHQVKSADLVTYDKNGNIIDINDRFKTDRKGEEAWKNTKLQYRYSDNHATELNLEHREYTLKEIRELFDQLNDYKSIKRLANKVFWAAEKLGARVYVGNRLTDTDLGEGTGTTGVSWGRDVVYSMHYFNARYVTDQTKAATIVHELIHTCTVYAMHEYMNNPDTSRLTDDMKNACKVLVDLYNKCKRKGMKATVDAAEQEAIIRGDVGEIERNSGWYAMTNPKEFVAELAEPKWREKLKSLHLLDKVLDAIRKFFGVENVKDDTYLESASAALNYILRHPDMARANDTFDYVEKKSKDWEDLNQTTRYRISDYAEEGVPVATPVDTAAIRKAVKGGDSVTDRYGYTIKVDKGKNNSFTVTVSKDGQVINTHTGTATPELKGADIERTAAAFVRNIRRGQARSRNMDTSDIYLEKGENPARDVNVPKRFGAVRKVSKLARTIAEAAGMTDEAVDTLLEKVNRGFLSYTPSVNKESMDKALNKIKDNMAAAVMEWENIRNRGVMKMTPDDVALGSSLMISAANSGDIDSAMEYAAQLQDMATAGGKLVQSFRMIKRLGAAGAFYYINRQIAKINVELQEAARGYQLQLNQDLVNQLMHATDYHEIRRIVDEIRKDLGSQLRPTLKDWLTAWRYTAMLGNLKTIARNYLGNALFIPSIMVRNVINAGLQSAFKPITRGAIKLGQKIAPKSKLAHANPFEKSTRVFASKKFRDFATWDWNDEVKYDIKGNKYSDETNEIKEYMKYTTGAPKWLKPSTWVFEQWRSLTRKAMETEGKAIFGGDMLFKRLHYKQALATQLQQRGANLELLKTVLPQVRNGKPMSAFNAEARSQLEIYNEATAYAQDEANRNTYNDLNAFAQEVARISRRLNTMQTKSGAPNALAKVGHYAVEGLLPFKNTPFNIAARATEFSPIGFIKTLTLDTYRLAKGQISGQEYLRNISGGLTGSMLFALGAVLAKMGILRGGLDYDDPEEEMLRKQGHQAYALEVGDTSVTLDWLAPEVIPMFMGVEFFNEIPNLKTWKETGLKSLLNSMASAYEPMLNMSMLQGVNALFEGAFTTSDDITGLARAASTTLTSFATQFQPTILAQLARTIDKTRRTTYIDKDSPLPPYIDKFWQKALMKIPFASKLLTPYLDEWGNETVNHPNGWLNALEQFLSPAYISTIKTDPVTQKLTELGPKSYPNKANRYIDFGEGENKQRYNLSSDEYVAYAALRGETAYAIVQNMLDNAAFQSLSDAEQLEVFKAAYNYADTIAQSAILEMKGLPAADVAPGALTKWVGKANQYAEAMGTPTALADFLLMRQGINDLGSTAREKRANYLWAQNVPANAKALLMELFDSSGGYAKGSQFYALRSKGEDELVVDFGGPRPVLEAETTPATPEAAVAPASVTPASVAPAATSEPEVDKYEAAATSVKKMNSQEAVEYLNTTSFTSEEKYQILAKADKNDPKPQAAQQFHASYGLSYDDMWDVQTKYNSNTYHGTAFHEYVDGKKNVKSKQKFALVELANSQSAWLDKANTASKKMGVTYDVMWKLCMKAEHESGRGKTDRLRAYAKTLGLSSSQFDKLNDIFKFGSFSNH